MMNEKRALVTIPTGERHRNLLQQAAPGWEFRFRGTDTLVCAPQEALPGQPVTQEDVDWAQVILGNVPAAMLHGSPALEWLQTNSAGVEPYIQPGVLAGTRCSPTPPAPTAWPSPSTCWACCWSSLKSWSFTGTPRKAAPGSPRGR